MLAISNHSLLSNNLLSLGIRNSQKPRAGDKLLSCLPGNLQSSKISLVAKQSGEDRGSRALSLDFGLWVSQLQVPDGEIYVPDAETLLRHSEFGGCFFHCSPSLIPAPAQKQFSGTPTCLLSKVWSLSWCRKLQITCPGTRLRWVHLMHIYWMNECKK